MLSLRSLTIRISECVQSQSDEVVKERLSELDLSSYPMLESFNFIITNKLGVKFQNLEQNVLSFLNFVSESQSKGSAVNLKFIGMYHNTLYKNGKRKPQRSKCFENVKNDGKSLKICKALIALTAERNDRNVKSIELNPVRMTSKDIDYLRFWFGGEFGKMEMKEYGGNVVDITVLGALEWWWNTWAISLYFCLVDTYRSKFDGILGVNFFQFFCVISSVYGNVIVY